MRGPISRWRRNEQSFGPKQYCDFRYRDFWRSWVSIPGAEGPWRRSTRLWHTGYALDYNSRMITLSVELEQEDDGRWIAEITELPGVLAYGENPGDARAKAQALALRVFADRLEHGEAGPDLLSISFKAA